MNIGHGTVSKATSNEPHGHRLAKVLLNVPPSQAPISRFTVHCSKDHIRNPFLLLKIGHYSAEIKVMINKAK